MKQASQVVKSLRKALFSGNDLVLAFAALELDRKRLADDTIAAVAHNALIGLEPPRAEADFKHWFDALRGVWYPEAMALGEALAEALKAWTTARTVSARLAERDYEDSQRDCWQGVQDLLLSETVRYASSDWLRQFPRYASAAEHRMTRLNGQYLKDQKAVQTLLPWRERLEQARAAYPGLIRLSAEAHQYRWMLEEFRVSLFAQQMKTRLPVSNKRLEQQWQLVQAWIDQHPR
jgi:ATP-dependent helicase HrpA